MAENEHVQFSYTQRKAEQNWLNSCKGQETLLASNVASAMGVKHRNVVSNKEGWWDELEGPGLVRQREPKGRILTQRLEG